LSQVTAAATLGNLVNAHMGLYYAWRFRDIHRKEKGDHSEADHIQKNDVAFSSEKQALDKEIVGLEADNDAALRTLYFAQQQRDAYAGDMYNDRSKLASYDEKIIAAQREQADTQDKLLRAKAKRDALPAVGSLQNMLALYDKQLLADARAIYAAYNRLLPGRSKPDPTLRDDLRPHYKGLMVAYENEYLLGKGLTDEKVIAFFDNYVHDSLAGFANDATLPSDPRAIYLGGSEKYKYAQLEEKRDSGLPVAEPVSA
jgi:hypothetical protein